MKPPPFPAAVLLVAALAALAPAQSLWNTSTRAPSLTSDTIARGVGDVLTVVISERQAVKNKEQTELKREASIDAALQNFDVLENAFGTLPAVQGFADREFKTDGKYDKEGSFQTRLSVVVIDVQPNGNLVIEGRRNVVMDQETKTIRITGIVRPFDVSPSNSVLSENIANASIAYEGQGVLSRNSNRGWLSELMDFVWPF